MPRRVAEVSIETVHKLAQARVVAAGEMDVACVVALNRAMSEATARNVPVDLDLSGVTFVDSRFSAAVGGWERELGPSRLTLKLPPDTGLQRVLALRSRKSARFRGRPGGQ
jgi:ABC-type transporter Mla MlaB component